MQLAMHNVMFWGWWKGECQISCKKGPRPLCICVQSCSAWVYNLLCTTLSFGDDESLILYFGNDGPPKKVNTFYLDRECIDFWMKNPSIHTKGCIVALSMMTRDGQFRIIYYSRIVKPNPESESLFFNKHNQHESIYYKFATTKAQSENEFIAVQYI